MNDSEPFNFQPSVGGGIHNLLVAGCFQNSIMMNDPINYVQGLMQIDFDATTPRRFKKERHRSQCVSEAPGSTLGSIPRYVFAASSASLHTPGAYCANPLDFIYKIEWSACDR